MTAAYTIQLYPKKVLLDRSAKYGAVSASYGDRMYHSRKEAAYAAELDQLKRATRRADRVRSWTPQVRVPLRVQGELVATYIADFEVTFADGRVELHEVKGFATEVWRLKKKLYDALYPDRPLKVIQ